MKKLPSKVAHNPTRLRVFSTASIWLCGTETVFKSEIFSSLKLSNFAGRKIILEISMVIQHSNLFLILGLTKIHFKQMLKVSAFYLEKQKSFIPKENIF